VSRGETEKINVPDLFREKENATVDNPGPFRQTDSTNMDSPALITDRQRASTDSSVFFIETIRVTMGAPVVFIDSKKATVDTAMVFRETQRTTAGAPRLHAENARALSSRHAVLVDIEFDPCLCTAYQQVRKSAQHLLATVRQTPPFCSSSKVWT
jgi:hypothetical protein